MTPKLDSTNRFWHLTILIIVIIATVFIFVHKRQLAQAPVDNSVSALTNDIRQHAPSILGIRTAPWPTSYWITEDGYMVQVKNQSGIVSYLSGAGDDPAQVKAVSELTEYSTQRLLDAGYRLDQDNSSTSTANGPIYSVKSAYISSDGISRCALGLPVESSVWSFECVNTQDIDKALEDSLPFLHALGDPKGVAATPGRKGNFAVVNVMAGAGYFAIMKEDADDQWRVIYQGQEAPSCALMNQYGVPQSIYGKCE
jgi:hypothetical protein